MPSETRVDSAFLPAFDAIAIDLPSQVDGVTALAELGDWEVVRTRLTEGMRLMENPISLLVKSIGQAASGELMGATVSLRYVQRRILIIVPVVTIATFSIAALFGWIMTQRFVRARPARGTQ